MSQITVEKDKPVDSWWFLDIKQEGFKGIRLFAGYVGDFIEALEDAEKDETLFFYQDFGVQFKAGSYTIVRHNKAKLLSFTEKQKTELIAALKTNFPDYL